ncbi:MAG: PIN domain-containing protein [Bacillota bacterium]
MRKSLIDAGPLIALFDRDDKYHYKVKDFLKNYQGLLVTSWSVITEVLHMLDFDSRAQINFLQWVERDAIYIAPLTKEHISRIIELSLKYSDLPMDFADATLIVISETEHIREIISIDSDFYIYRNIRKEMLINILEADKND